MEEYIACIFRVEDQAMQGTGALLYNEEGIRTETVNKPVGTAMITCGSGVAKLEPTGTRWNPWEWQN